MNSFVVEQQIDDSGFDDFVQTWQELARQSQIDGDNILTTIKAKLVECIDLAKSVDSVNCCDIVAMLERTICTVTGTVEQSDDYAERKFAAMVHDV